MASEETAVAAEPERRVDQSKYSKRVILKTILCRQDGGLGLIGERVVIGGWVKSSKEIRGNSPSMPSPVKPTRPPVVDLNCSEVIQSRMPQCLQSIVRIFFGGGGPRLDKRMDVVAPERIVPTVAYLLLNDGSCISSLQVVVVDSPVVPISKITPVGTSILGEGVVQKPSAAGKRVIELKVEKILHVGTVDAEYPLTKPRLPLDFLRSHPHLRPRTIVVATITRIRNALSNGTHTFFQDNGFLHVNMPIITATDSISSDEMFHVTTLFNKSEKIEEPNVMTDNEAISVEVVRAAIKEKSKRVQELQRSESNKEALLAALLDLKKTSELALQMEEHKKLSPGTSFKVGKVDFLDDFFSCQAFLAVSPRLHLESYASALGCVYTFGPKFGAEKFHSPQHLAESWTVDVGIAFADLEDLMNFAEDYLKFLCQIISNDCKDDMGQVMIRIDKTSVDRVLAVARSEFERITYTNAVELLKEVKDKTFETKVEWGISLTEEHQRYLADETYKRPVIIYDYPKDICPFYVRANDDGKTAAAMDVIVPKAGILIRGSQREERLDMINERITEMGLPKAQYDWYLDLRRRGGAVRSGFSLGFEQMVMFVTGLEDIRDAIPFPRTSGTLTC